MTAFLDFIFGLFSINLFSLDYSKLVEKAKIIEEPNRTIIVKAFNNHLNLDPATASITYNQLLIKPISKNLLYIIALNDRIKVFSYFCKNEWNDAIKGYGLIEQ